MVLIGAVIALAVQDRLIAWGALGLLGGSGFAWLYFAFWNSRFGHGQTIGKRLFNIRVLDRTGQEISFGKSLARAVIYATPFLLSGNAYLPLFQQMELTIFLNIVQWLVVIGIPFCQIFLYVFERTTVHDLVLGTTVSDLNGGAETDGLISRTGIIIVTVVGLAALVSGAYFANSKYHHRIYAQSYPLVQDFYRTGHYASVDVFDKEEGCLFVVVSLKRSMSNYDVYCEILRLLAKREKVLKVDQVDITIEKRFSIGIIQWRDFPVRCRKSLAQWKYDLNEMKGLDTTRPWENGKARAVPVPVQ